jgi:hypothetical protein
LEAVTNKIEGIEFDKLAVINSLPKKQRKMGSFEIWDEFVESYGDSVKHRMYKERCLISTKKELLNILKVTKPTLDRFEKIGIIEREYGKFDLLAIRENLNSTILPQSPVA